MYSVLVEVFAFEVYSVYHASDRRILDDYTEPGFKRSIVRHGYSSDNAMFTVMLLLQKAHTVIVLPRPIQIRLACF